MDNKKEKMQTAKNRLRVKIQKADTGVLGRIPSAAAFGSLYLGIFALAGTMSGGMRYELLAGLAGLAVLVGCIFTEGKGKNTKAAVILHGCMALSALALLILLLVKGNWVYQGALLSCNDFMEQIGRIIGKFEKSYAAAVPESLDPVCRGLFFLFFGLFLSSILELLRRGRSIAIPAVLGLFPAFVQLFWYREQILPGVILVYLAVFLLAAFRVKGKRAERSAGSAADIQNTAVILLLFLAILIPASVITKEGYTRGGFVKSITDRVENAARKLCCGEKKADSLPEGKLKDLGSLTLGEGTVLNVIMEKPSSVYLRGFVGSVYTGESWEEADKDAVYEKKDMFYWLHQSGFSGLTQLASLYQLENQDDTDTGDMVIENVGANRRYCYAPYELTALPEEIEDCYSFGDISLKKEGLFPGSTSSFTVHTGLVKYYPQIAADYYQKQSEEAFSWYDADENSYNAFVYENFLEVPERLMQMFAGMFGEENLRRSDAAHISYEKANTLVTGYLNQNIQYSEDISENTEDGDFVTNFLLTDKKGYSVHYATAAVLMYRSLGIPARYVEGYLITPEMAEGLESYAKFAVTGREAHAWAEIYQDGVGWIPMEVTPPYLDKMERPDFEIAVYESANQEGSGSAGGTAEEILDEEEKKPETQKGRKQLPVLKIALTVFAILFLLALAAAVCHILYRRRQLAEEKKRLEDPDTRIAVRSCFACLMRWLHYDGLPVCGGSRYDAEEKLRQKYGDGFAVDYVRAVAIAEEAAYSSHPMSREQAEYVRTLLGNTQKQILGKQTLPRKLRMRIRDFMY